MTMAAPPVPRLQSTQELLKDTNISYLKVLTAAEHPDVDIVAVHGLRIPLKLSPWKEESAFGVRTWVAGMPGEEMLWLKDLLPSRIKNVRVLLFGYNSNVGLNTSSAGVTGAADDLLAKLKIKRKDCTDRPIIFFCHSLGGIVVKHAISKARSTLEYKDDIYGHVRAIAFFATPHRGGLGAKLGQALAGGLRHLTRNVRSSIMEALREDSLISSDIHRYFLDCLSDANIRVCSFYETKPLPGLTQMVVDKNSAMLGLPYPQEVTYPVPEANHSEVCKFASETENYNLVISKIEELVNWTLLPPEMPFMTQNESTLSLSQSSIVSNSDTEPDGAATRLQAPSMMFYSIRSSSPHPSSPRPLRKKTPLQGPFYVLPDVTSEDFVGQKPIMDRLQEILSLDQDQHVRAALYGLGGVGKTQIALKTASWYKEKYPSRSIFWLRGGNPTALLLSFADIAAQCDLVEEGDRGTLPLEEIQRFLLDRENGKWLMIVDNADSAKTFSSPANSSSSTHYYLRGMQKVPLITLFPRCAHGQILFTTKSKAIAAQLTMQSRYVMEVRPMDQQDSHRLLSNRLFEATELSISPPSYEREIPTGEAIEKLCTHLGHLPLALTQAAAFMRQQSLTVNEYIKLLDVDDSNLSDLLEHDFQSYGPEDDFSKAVASTWKASFDQIEIDSPSAISLLSLMAFLDPDGIPKFLLRKFEPDEWQLTAKSLGALQGYAFVHPIPGADSFKIHRMVQLAVRKRLASLGSATTWASKTLKLLADSFPYKTLQNCAPLIPHAVKILNNELAESTENNLLIGILASKVGWYYNSWVRLTEAQNYMQQAWEHLKSVPSPPKELFLDVKATRALVLRETGLLTEAEELGKEVLAECRKTLGETHRDTVEIYNTLTKIYQDQGYYAKSVKIARSTLKALRKRPAADDITVLDVKARLGVLLTYLGDYKEAEIQSQEAYNGYVERLGHHNFTALRTRYNLARAIHFQGRFEESMRITMETWTIQKSAFGEQHPETFKSRLLVARNLQAQSDFKPALEHMREIHKATSQLGSYHRHSLLSASYLASCLIASVHGKDASQEYDEAEELLRCVLAGARQQLRKGHPETQIAKTGLATILRLRSSFEEAETLQREALDALKGELGKTHPWFLSGRENLARILWEQKASKSRTKEALKVAQKVLKQREKHLSWNHADTRRIAELVTDLLPSGRQKVTLEEKLEKEVKEIVIQKDSASLSGEMLPPKAGMMKEVEGPETRADTGDY